MIPDISADAPQLASNAGLRDERDLPSHQRWGRAALRWAVLAFTCAIPLGEGLAQAMMGLVAALLLLAPWVLGKAPRQETGGTSHALVVPLLVAFAAYLVALYLPMPFSGIGGVGWPSSAEGAKPLNMLIFPLLLWAGRYLDERDLRRMAIALLVGFTIASVIGLAQHFLGIRWDAGLAKGARLSGQRRVPGDPAGIAATGPLLNRLKMAHLLVLGLAVSIGLALRTAWYRDGVLRWLLPIAVVVQLLVLPFTYARGALLAVLVVGGAAAIFFARAWGRVAMAAGLALMLAVVALSPNTRARAAALVQRMGQHDRLFLWARALEIGSEQPLVGMGYGTYVNIGRRVYNRVDPKIAFPWKRSHHKTGHNQLLTTFVEGGLPAFAALLAMLGILGVISFTRARAGPPSPAAGIAAGVYLVVVGICLVSFIHDTFHHIPVLYAFCWAAAMLLLSLRRVPSSS